MFRSSIVAATILGAVVSLTPIARAADIELLNVSYDPTRELLKDIGNAFRQSYKKSSGHDVTVKQSHAGSGAQARAVIDGLDADVVTLALWPDVDAIRKAGLIANKWEERLPNQSRPWTSTIVFVVRKGNPKGVKDWPDLIKPDIEIITPNPKTSGNGKLSFLAAWGSVTQRGGSEADAEAFVTKLYRQAPVLDAAARGSTTTFAQKKIGDVHLTWENEAHLEVKESKGNLEIVYPPISILADPPVSVVDANVQRKGTGDAAKAYLEFLYSLEGQEIIARHYFRPSDTSVLARHAATFPEIKLFPITAIAGDWNDANARYFGEGKIFDNIYKPDR